MPGNSPTDKLAIAREYERIHLSDIDDAAQRGTEILMREIYTPKKDRIQKYADTLAERIDLKDPMLDITDKKNISAYIKRKYRELGVPETIVNHINDYLTDEYKNKSLERVVVEANGTETGADLGEVKKMDNFKLQKHDEWIEEQKKKNKAEAKRLNDIQALVHEEAGERHLQLESMKSEVVSTPKIVEDAEGVKLVEELAKKCVDVSKQLGNPFTRVLVGEVVVNMLKASSKTIEYPASPEDTRRYIQAAKLTASHYQPLGDLKNTKDTRGWLETIKTYEEYGKHAAAVKNAVVTPDGTVRPLTREQVGDKVLEVLEGAIAMYNTDPLLVVFAEHHRKYKEPNIGERKELKHDDLSNKA